MTAIAALMLLAPIASAAPLYNFTAPYTGMTKSLSNTVSYSGCSAAASEPVAPAFSFHSGKFVSDMSTSVGSCAASSYSSSIVYTSVSLTGPAFKVGSAGAHQVASYWSTTYAADLAVHGHSTYTNTSYSFVYAAVSIYVYMYIFDVTSNTYFFGNGSYYATIASWTLSSTGSLAITSGPSVTKMWQNGALQPGHTYETYLWVYTEAYSEVYSYGAPFHASASASLNLATSGNGIHLDRITVL